MRRVTAEAVGVPDEEGWRRSGGCAPLEIRWNRLVLQMEMGAL